MFLSKYVKEVLEILEKRLDDKGKNWRHVMKVCSSLYCKILGLHGIESVEMLSEI